MDHIFLFYVKGGSTEQTKQTSVPILACTQCSKVHKKVYNFRKVRNFKIQSRLKNLPRLKASQLTTNRLSFSKSGTNGQWLLHPPAPPPNYLQCLTKLWQNYEFIPLPCPLRGVFFAHYSSEFGRYLFGFTKVNIACTLSAVNIPKIDLLLKVAAWVSISLKSVIFLSAPPMKRLSPLTRNSSEITKKKQTNESHFIFRQKNYNVMILCTDAHRKLF